MKYIADLHVHSRFSRATSKAADLEGYYQWANIKGIHLVGTGDFTHPVWLKELKEKLVRDESGFFRLKDLPVKSASDPLFADAPPHDIDMRFCLSAELSTIYKKNGKTRKVHSVVFAPDFKTVEKINAKLTMLGKNLSSDGRPILGMDTKNLLEIVLEASDEAYLVPAHIWTPWFSLFGSSSGFDNIEECFEDLSSHVFSLETGLSSDPEMNFRLSALDRFTLVSNSDAHSPQRLGREATVFDTGFDYKSMFHALKTRQGYAGTIEFYPEEGKYHLDGHRKCNVCFEPEQTRKYKGLCPECGKKLTVGVMHRVLELADRKKGEKPANASDFRYLIPLPEVIAEILGTGPTSKSVNALYAKIIGEYGSEFGFLLDTPVDDIERKSGVILSQAVGRMRSGQIDPKPGYDGEFGIIKVFTQSELEKLRGQKEMFDLELAGKTRRRAGERDNLSAEKPVKKKTGRTPRSV